MQKYQHKFISSLTCEIVQETNKGFKVSQIDTKERRPKAKTAFYNTIDFDEKKGFWQKM